MPRSKQTAPKRKRTYDQMHEDVSVEQKMRWEAEAERDALTIRCRELELKAEAESLCWDEACTERDYMRTELGAARRELLSLQVANAMLMADNAKNERFAASLDEKEAENEWLQHRLDEFVRVGSLLLKTRSARSHDDLGRLIEQEDKVKGEAAPRKANPPAHHDEGHAGEAEEGAGVSEAGGTGAQRTLFEEDEVDL